MGPDAKAIEIGPQSTSRPRPGLEDYISDSRYINFVNNNDNNNNIYTKCLQQRTAQSNAVIGTLALGYSCYLLYQI